MRKCFQYFPWSGSNFFYGLETSELSQPGWLDLMPPLAKLELRWVRLCPPAIMPLAVGQLNFAVSLFMLYSRHAYHISHRRNCPRKEINDAHAHNGHNQASEL